MHKLLIIVLSVFVLISCKDKQPNKNQGRISGDDSIEVSKNYDSIIQAEQKAKNDSAYRKSETYRYAMENYHRAIAEKTKGMTHVQQVLCEYEAAINNLYETGKFTAAHPDKMNKKMQDIMRERGEKVMELYEQLNKFHMSPAEKKRFDELNKKKDFY